MKTRMTSEPGAHGRRLVSPVVVHHQMHLQLRRDVGFDRTQELQELNAAMAPMQLADDFSGSYIQGREQRRGAMAFVIVRTALGYAGGQWQNRLSPVQWVSSPGEFHPEALAEPDVRLAPHTAPIIQP